MVLQSLPRLRPKKSSRKGTSDPGLYHAMNALLFGFCLVCLSLSRVQSKPQTTKLFPIREETNNPADEASNEAKPLDRLLGKLRATYNFVFRKPENTSNVEKILAKDRPDPDVEALKLIWSDRMRQNSVDSEPTKRPHSTGTYLGPRDDWVNYVQPLDRLEPLEPLESLEPLELEEDDEVEVDKNRDVEIVTPRTPFQFPVTLSRHLVDWIGSLLGITYSVYSKLARIVSTNHTAIRVK